MGPEKSRDDGSGPLAACTPLGRCPRYFLIVVNPLVASLTIE